MTTRRLIIAAAFILLIQFLFHLQIVDSFFKGVFDPLRAVSPPPFNDLGTYWIGWHLISTGLNPYDQAVFENAVRLHGFGDAPVLQPPWILALLSPLLALPQHSSLGLLFLLSSSALIAVPIIVWKTYHRAEVSIWACAVSSLTFVPAFETVRCGQFALLLTLCLAAGLLALKEKKDALAGIFFFLCIIKPQLFLIFGAALAVEIVRQGRWTVALGAALPFAALLAATPLLAPGALRDWLAATEPLLVWKGANLPTVIRALILSETGTLPGWPSIAVPVLCQVGVAAWILLSRRSLLEPKVLSIVLCLTLFCAPYCWFFDHAVLLIPYSLLLSFTFTAKADFRRRSLVIGVLLALMALLLLVRPWAPYDYQLFWFSMALLAVLLWGYRVIGGIEKTAP